MEVYKKELYQTSDFGEASALVYCEHIPEKMIRDKYSQRVTFFFEDNEDVQSTLASYWNHELVADLKGYYEVQQSLKKDMRNLIESV